MPFTSGSFAKFSISNFQIITEYFMGIGFKFEQSKVKITANVRRPFQLLSFTILHSIYCVDLNFCKKTK